MSRIPAPRRTLPILLLGLSLASVALLALQAWGAERGRLAGAHAAIDGFEEVVAFQLSARLFSELNAAFQPPFIAVEQADASVRGIDVLLEHPGELERCTRTDERWAVRVPLPSPSAPVDDVVASAEWSSASPPEARQRGIVEGLFNRWREHWQDWTIYLIEATPADDDGPVSAVVGSSIWRPGVEGSSLYAFSTCLDVGGRSVFDVAVDAGALLPAELLGGHAPRDAFHLAVSGTDGRRLWSGNGGLDVEQNVEPPTVVALDPPFEGLGVMASATPVGASALVPGTEVGGFGLLTIAGLVLLNALLLGAAVVQFRRESELIRAREGFVSAVSHELRTPLQQMLIFGDLLSLDRFEDDADRARAVAVITRETRRLAHLVENVLSFRPEIEGAPVPTRAEIPYRLDPLIEMTVAEFAPLAESRRARVSVSGRAGADVDWHPDAVRRVLLNLLDNAVKYGSGEVVVKVASDGREALIAVIDDGPGIEPEARARVVEPYRRGDGEHTATQGGSGLGLAIVADLLDRVGGRLDLEDAPGGGLRASVRFPLHVPGGDDGVGT